jgi:hypothetical protein
MAIDTRYFTDDVSSLHEALTENLGGEPLTPQMLTQVKVPAGGATKWEVPGIDEETESLKDLEGVILSWTQSRAYWANPLSTEKAPPVCRSEDMQTGIGTPGGSCASCPFAQFGSAAAGRGQACKSKMTLFLVRPGETLPIAVSIPATSVTAIRGYLMHLASKKLPFHAVVSKLSLTKVENKGGQTYSQVRPTLVRPLSTEDRVIARSFKETLAAVLSAPTLPQRAWAAANVQLPPAATPPALTSHVNAEDL